MVAMLLTLVSCGSNTDTQHKAYSNSSEALADYASYLDRISAKKNVATKELVDLVKEWKVLDDTIANQFFSAAYSEASTDADSSYVSLREQILESFANMVDTRQRSLEDYLDVVTNVHPSTPTTAAQDSLVTSMHHFYSSMDGTNTFGLGNAATVVRYEQILSEALAKGLHTKPDVFTFLKAEDRAFRSFLEHLPTLGNIPLIKVRDNTSLLLKQIVELAADSDGVFTPEEVVTIITMRNTRRLTQNAQQCVKDISAGKVGRAGGGKIAKAGKDDQATAYMWMLLQPWVSFDTYAFTLMSNDQLKTMRQLAQQTPKCIIRLGNPDFPISPDELPNLLIKTFITTL
jgi:hypothetical protein